MDEPTKPGAVLVISSQVGRGAIGARAAVFVLERLGLSTWLVPTVWMPWHPGHGRSTRIATPPEAFAAALAEIAESPAAGEIATVSTGYFADAEQVEAAARLVERLRLATPGLRLVVDPVIGDGQALYVPHGIAAAVRDRLVPLADVVTPNLFEAGWLADRPIATTSEAIAAVRGLGVPAVVVTSAPAMMSRSIAVLAVTADAAFQIEHPRLDDVPHGTGDLFAALLAARLTIGASLEVAATRSVAAVFEVVARSVRAGSDELAIAAEQGSLVHALAQVSVRRIGERGVGPARRPLARPSPLSGG